MSMTKMVLPFGILYVMNQVDQEDPDNIMYMRIYFAACMVGTALLWLTIRSRILASDNKDTIHVSESDLMPPNPLGIKSGSDTKNEMKVVDYDMSKVNEKLKQIFIQGAIISGIHYKWGACLPLVISSTMGLIGLVDDPLIMLYVMGKTPEQDPSLKRPFPAPKNPFAEMLGQEAPADTAAAAPVADKPSDKKKD